MATPKIAMIVANKTIAPTTGWPVGFWIAELTHPCFLFEDQGYDVTIVSPEGGAVFVDPYSDPRHESGYSAHDFVSLGFLQSPQRAALLEKTAPLSAIDPNDFAAIVIAGGQAPMFTFRGNKEIDKLFMAFYDAGKPSAALCHGVAALMDMKTSDGAWLIKGKTMTGFSLAEDDFVDKTIGKKIFEWHIEPLARERGADYREGGMWASFAVEDGNLITGQQQNSGAAVASLVIRQLRARG
jgi:putative intracellular protease/amidase